MSSTPPPPPNYNNLTFASKTNTPNGQVSASTLFHYHQSASPTGPIVWADYSGGQIAQGFLIATIQADGVLDARYQHVNTSGELMTGKCKSTPESHFVIVNVSFSRMLVFPVQLDIRLKVTDITALMIR